VHIVKAFTTVTSFSKLLTLILLITLPFVGFFMGYTLNPKIKKASYSVNDLSQIRQGKNNLTNPLLACGTGTEIVSPQATQFKQTLESFINQKKSVWNVTDLSLYYRNLDSGDWMGINKDAQYSPASMFKVPIAINFYKLAETSPDILNQSLQFDIATKAQVDSSDQLFPPNNHLEVGKAYTVEELIQNMLIYSENDALQLLQINMDHKNYDNFLTQLGIAPLTTTDNPNVSAADFSLILRVLYNATYLSPKDSEKILTLLSQSDFKEGLVAGIPPTVTIAHKFGEREYGAGNQELHECGIIYTDSPYLLCVMTRGSDIKKQVGALRDISQFIYSGVNAKAI
jgi:beta-lactamase class A